MNPLCSRIRPVCRAFAAIALLCAYPAAAAVPWLGAVTPDQLSFEGSEADILHDGGLLRIRTRGADAFPSVLIHAPDGHWDLSNHRKIETRFTNTCTAVLNMAFWAVGAPGWDAPVGSVSLAPDESGVCSIDLTERWNGGLVPKVDARRIAYLRVSLVQPPKNARFEMGPVFLRGEAERTVAPKGYERLEVPAMQEGKPAAGRRVRHQLPEFRGSEIYHALYLPTDWKPGQKFPVIVEYSGNRWLNPPCHSVGRPESGRMGYGMSEGKGFIWVNAPYVNYRTRTQALNGWGSADDTADYAVRLVDDICTRFGGDPDHVYIAGFSRGAVACGFIGLHNEKVSSLWKGFIPCQHYDGDGTHGATYESALKERMPRLRGRTTFHIDNGRHKELHRLFELTGQPVIFAESGIGAHTDSLFLENRPAVLQLRRWLHEITTGTE